MMRDDRPTPRPAASSPQFALRPWPAPDAASVAAIVTSEHREARSSVTHKRSPHQDRQTNRWPGM